MASTHPVETIAKLLILTERRVQQLAREGILPKADHNMNSCRLATDNLI